MNKIANLFGAVVKYEPLFSNQSGSVYSVTSTGGKMLFDVLAEHYVTHIN